LFEKQVDLSVDQTTGRARSLTSSCTIAGEGQMAKWPWVDRKFNFDFRASFNCVSHSGCVDRPKDVRRRSSCRENQRFVFAGTSRRGMAHRCRFPPCLVFMSKPIRWTSSRGIDGPTSSRREDCPGRRAAPIRPSVYRDNRREVTCGDGTHFAGSRKHLAQAIGCCDGFIDTRSCEVIEEC